MERNDKILHYRGLN
ncbi:TPA: hypothetical protein ACGR50_002269 [Escherichia coli]